MHKRNPVLLTGKVLGKCLSHVCLPRAGRPLEYDLLLVLQQGVDFFQEFNRKVQLGGEIMQIMLRLYRVVFRVTLPDCPDHRLRVETVA